MHKAETLHLFFRCQGSISFYFSVYKALASKRCPSIHSALYLVGIYCTSAEQMNISRKKQEGKNSVTAKRGWGVKENGILSSHLLL